MGFSYKTLGWLLTGLYLAAVAFMVFWPTHVDSGETGEIIGRLLAAGHTQGWLPTWFGYGHAEWLSNVVMFIPGGFLLTWLVRPGRTWLIPLGGLACTLTIESIQHFMPGRTSSPLDVVANFLGCVIGWVFFLGLLKIKAKRNKISEKSPVF